MHIKSRNNFNSFIPGNKNIPELTIKSFIIGFILALIFGITNIYVGLYAGILVLTIIPGVVVAFIFIKALKGTVLEVNYAAVCGSAGEALTAGVIFTIPALVILGIWTEIHYFETILIVFLGGILGVLCSVPLRRLIIDETNLVFPEAVATATFLTTSDETFEKKPLDISAIWIFIGIIIAIFISFGQSILNIFSTKIEGILNIDKYGGESDTYMYGGVAVSPALLSIGWITGPKISSFIFFGGLVAWIILLPLFILINGISSTTTPMEGVFEIWGEQIRYAGIGAMFVGIFCVFFKIRSNILGLTKKMITGEIVSNKRTGQDMDLKRVLILIGILIIPIFLIYGYISNLWAASFFMAILVIFFAFFACILVGYLTGFVGASNITLSAIAASVVFIVSLIILFTGIGGAGAFGLVILFAAVICCAASVSGRLFDSMACGRMIGAKPANLQISMIIGVIAACIPIVWIMQLLDRAYMLGSTRLPAPQAYLIAGFIKGLFTGEMLWIFVIIGIIIAAFLIPMEYLMKKPVILAFAIGICLPFTISTTIFTGGLIRLITDRFLKKKYNDTSEDDTNWNLAIKQTNFTPKERVMRTGLLFTSGLIAGEALLTVLLAFLVFNGINLYIFPESSPILGFITFIVLIALLLYIPMKQLTEK